MASQDVYLNRYAQPDKAWTAQSEDRWAVPYWYIDERVMFNTSPPDL